MDLKRLKVRVALSFAAMLAALSAHAQTVTHYRPDGHGGFIAETEQKFQRPSALNPQWAENFRNGIRRRIPSVPYELTPEERVAPIRDPGTASAEERVTENGSQYRECEDRMYRLGYSHFDIGHVCQGLSVKAPSKAQQAAWDAVNNAEMKAMGDASQKRRDIEADIARDQIIAKQKEKAH